MLYLALLFAAGYEWMALGGSEAEAKQKVFDGFNTYLMRQEEMRLGGKTQTYEYLHKKLKEYYRDNIGGDVSIDTLIASKKFQLEVFDLEINECYRNGHKVPSRIQDF